MRFGLKRILLCLSLLLLAGGCANRSNTLSGTTAGNEDKAAQINTQLGIAYMRQGRTDQAMLKLQKAVRESPNYADGHAAIAVLYEHLGERAQAERHYKRALDLAPQDSSNLNNYGRFLCAQGKLDRVEALFKQAAENPLYRTPEVPLTNAGVCALKLGERAKAEQYFLKALQANSEFAPALIRMGEVRLENGHSLSARGFYQRYLDVATQTPETLLLGIRVEKALGNLDAVGSYSLLLKSKFPDSEETRRLLEMESNEQ